jgi:hypothetical protein
MVPMTAPIERWRVPDALQPPVGQFGDRSWVEVWIALERATEYYDPLESIAIYTSPRELRPSSLPPVARRATWHYLRDRSQDDATPDVMQCEIPAEAFAGLELIVSRLLDELPQFPFQMDRLDPKMEIEIAPEARTWQKVRWRTRMTDVNLGWTKGTSIGLDREFASVWNEMLHLFSPTLQLSSSWRELT